MDNAWMIRNDGKAFPCKVHVYGDSKDEDFDIYNCMTVCDWLYDHTRHTETKENIIELLAYIAYDIDPDNDIVDTLMKERKDYGIEYMSEKFINKVKDKLHNVDIDEGLTYQTEDLGWRLYDELNQEFLRARYGGMYDTARGSREMYFRISSVGFNWFDIIWEFTYNMQDRIDKVTVVRDEESTGAKNQYYYKSMDIHEFLTLKGNPVVESLTITDMAWSSVSPMSKMIYSLSEGNSISHVVEGLPMNNQRGIRLYSRLNLLECGK